ncbi:MAG: twin-arginine translocase TatA/TatE family subunit [Saprospiraceae bacterium]|nr:twin-arginine translocase TatA/TatE family subunit [Saprospiraceae bacterium]
MTLIFIGNIFSPEVLVVLFAILLLFGGKKIPELMRGLGRGIREFNTARNTLESELKEGMRENEAAAKKTRRE